MKEDQSEFNDNATRAEDESVINDELTLESKKN